MTYLYKQLSKTEFRDAFKQMGRKDQFSYRGLGSLYDWLIEYVESTGEPMELDVIALCCDFVEYENLNAFREEYGEEYTTYQSIDENTLLIKIEDSDGFIIQSF